MDNKNTIENTSFEIVPDDSGLELTSKNALEISFRGFFEEAERWKLEAAGITNPKTARTARLELRSLRIAAEKKRKELKEDSLRMGKAIDGANNILKALVVPIEKNLENIEKAEERRIEAEMQELIKRRNQAYQEFHDPDLPFPDFSGMTDEQFEASLKNAMTIARVKAEEKAKAEEKERARAKREAEEREAQRLENIKLKKEAEEREDELRKAKAKADKVKAEMERKANEERAEAKAKADKLALEAKELREAAEREKKREEEEKRIELEKARKAASAPDKAKIEAFSDEVQRILCPKMKTEEGREVEKDINSKIQSFASWIKKQTKTL